MSRSACSIWIEVCRELVELDFTFLLEARDYPWGRSAYLRDPDGRLVELAQASQ